MRTRNHAPMFAALLALVVVGIAVWGFSFYLPGLPDGFDYRLADDDSVVVVTHVETLPQHRDQGNSDRLMAGIVAALPTAVAQLFELSSQGALSAFVLILLLVLDAVTQTVLIAALGATRTPPDDDDVFDLEAAPYFGVPGPGGIGITVRNEIRDPHVLARLGALLVDRERPEVRMAAAAALQGLTVHFLVTSSYQLRPGDRCLIHAGAGGVGGLLIQAAKHIGAEVFTTVGSTAKAAIARDHGADHVIVYTEEDFAGAIRRPIRCGTTRWRCSPGIFFWPGPWPLRL